MKPDLYRYLLDNAPADPDFIATADRHMVSGAITARALRAGLSNSQAMRVVNRAADTANL